LKRYIDFRVWLAKRNIKLAGKWKNYYRVVSPELVKQVFGSQKVVSSKSFLYAKKEKISGTKYHGNRRMDFVIKL